MPTDVRARLRERLYSLVHSYEESHQALAAGPTPPPASAMLQEQMIVRDQLKQIMKTISVWDHERRSSVADTRAVHSRAKQTLMSRHHQQWSRASARLDCIVKGADDRTGTKPPPIRARSSMTSSATRAHSNSRPRLDPGKPVSPRPHPKLPRPSSVIVKSGADDPGELVEFVAPPVPTAGAGDDDNDNDDDLVDVDTDEDVDLVGEVDNDGTASIVDVPRSAAPVTLQYRMNGDNRILRALLHQAGFTRTYRGHQWDLHWTGRAVVRNEVYRHLRAGQKISRFPNVEQLTRKDSLFMNIARMQRLHAAGNPFCFIPETFLLPMDADKLDRAYHSLANRSSLWIVKPHAASQGRGIFVTRQLTDIPHNAHLIVSRYIAHPYLINGRKFDIRLYVAVTSFDPLRIYVHEEGLLRFATEPYDISGKSLDNPFVHLTNYSINKNSAAFIRNHDANDDDGGHKWSLTALRRHLRARGLNDRSVFNDIHQIILKTIVSIEDQVNAAVHKNVGARDSCFCLLGFDVLLDATLRPWLLEVNGHPSLSSDSPLDYRIKSTILADLLTMLGIQNRKPATTTTGSAQSARYRASAPSYWLRGRNRDDALVMQQIVAEESAREYERRRGWARVFPFAGGSVHKAFFGVSRDLNMLMCKIQEKGTTPQVLQVPGQAQDLHRNANGRQRQQWRPTGRKIAGHP
ncbi:Tubulin--tyrosine ligase-like protein 5 [Plasmodiophora brassicae]